MLIASALMASAPPGRFLFQAFVPDAAASEPLAAWITAPSPFVTVAAR